MYTLAFILATIGPNGAMIEVHGAFETVSACEYAASIVEQNAHPLAAGVTIECLEAEIG